MSIETKFGCINGQQTGLIGLYSVCRELARRGWNPLPTARNARGIDIVIYSQDGTRMHGVQVKSLRDANSAAPLKNSFVTHGEKPLGDFWIIVNNLGLGEPRYFVARADEIMPRATVYKGCEPWLHAPTRKDPQKGYGAFADRWDIIGPGWSDAVQVEPDEAPPVEA